MLAFRSLDPFRALREPDRRRRDEERLSRSEQRTLSKTQNNHLTGKAPYKFESGLLQRGVSCEPDFLASDFRKGQVATARLALSRKPGRKRAAYPIGCRRGPALLAPPSLPARDHPARDLALSPLHPELPRCRGTAISPVAVCVDLGWMHVRNWGKSFEWHKTWHRLACRIAICNACIKHLRHSYPIVQQRAKQCRLLHFRTSYRGATPQPHHQQNTQSSVR